MIHILLTLALQATLEEGTPAALPCKDPMLVTASSTGRFLVVAEAKKVHVLDGETLRPVHAVDFEPTAVGFDAQDEVLTIVGTQAVRFETKGWKETFRADLPDVELRKASAAAPRIIVDLRQLDPPDGWLAGQAMVSPEGDVYYRSKGGRLMRAKGQEGKWVGEQVFDQFPNEDAFDRVECILGIPPGPVLVRVRGDVMGVVYKRKIYTLAVSAWPRAVGLNGAEVPVVTAKRLCVYDSATWKNLGFHGELKDDYGNRAAVFDSKRGCFYIARGDGLRTWDGGKGSEDKPVEGVAGNLRGLAIDGAGTRLYGVEKEKLRSWRLKD